VAELSRHGSTHASDWPSRKIAAWYAQPLHLFALHRSQLQRPGRAQSALRRSQLQRPGRAQRRRGVRGSPPTTKIQLARAPRKANSSAAARLSEAEKGGFGGLPRLLQFNSHARRRRPSRAQWPGRAQWGMGVQGSHPTTAIQLARTPKKAKPSAAARPSAAEKGESGGLRRLH
jgi:hypothetical protein